MTDIITFRPLLLPMEWQTAGLLSEATAAVAAACSGAATASWLLFLAALSVRGLPPLLPSPLGVPDMPGSRTEGQATQAPLLPRTRLTHIKPMLERLVCPTWGNSC